MKNTEIKALGTTLLETGALLMVCGASTGRVRNTINRISESFGYTTDMLISQRSLMLNVSKNEYGQIFSSLKRTKEHTINFSILSGISRMSWMVVEENWTIKQIDEEIERLKSKKTYPRITILILVGLAGVAFCRLAGGDYLEMGMVFIGSFLGLLIKQQATKMKYNSYICVYFAALTSSLIAGIPLKFYIGNFNEHAFATSVLFLIPGVPLINSFSDIIEGNLQNGLIRGLNGFIISFSIAMGLLSSMLIYNF